jgi:hypothetical protein
VVTPGSAVSDFTVIHGGTLIELRDDALQFSFPSVHRSARLSIDFQRTLRIPDDDQPYRLPPGLGRFPLRHVDDFQRTVPAKWLEHGGVMLPMYQAEAMWINFHCGYDEEREESYPFAVRIAAGKINAVTGQQWTSRLHEDPQDYVVPPTQPWLDGFCGTKGIIRQFVAMPLGRGYTSEEQITGEGQYGGVQVVVHPMKREAFERWFPKVDRTMRLSTTCVDEMSTRLSLGEPEMGLGAGGRMRQEVYDDPYGFDEWDQSQSARCFIHITNSTMWRAVTGEALPTPPPTAAQYTKAGLPWFEYYGEGPAVDGSLILRGIKSVFQVGRQRGETPLPENEPVTSEKVVTLRKGLGKNQVREGSF